MGYTHYFELKADLKSEVLRDVSEIIDHNEEILAYEDDETGRKPSVNEKEIRFNGRDGDGHETFLIEKGVWEFCKTARKPYDLPVCEVLLVLKYHYGDDFSLSSDGFCTDGLDGNWAEAYENVKGQFKYGDFDFVDE
ncbi:hypothetical protein [Neobacillus muris]|uniref:hypothetical protein n=1 Tax=Neobacillus muris TaxID=2941334 RepID=UPI00203E23DA|nr:hypothetical protein [Neobacillus muris]